MCRARTRRRHCRRRDDLTRDFPERSLTKGRKRRAGRNHQGKLTVRHRGGGSKRLFRDVDFRRRRDGIPAKVAAIGLSMKTFNFLPVAAISLN